MDMDEAISQATPPTAAPTTTFEQLEAKAVASHESPQRANAASRGFAMLREGLALLASLGHSLHIAESGAMPIVVFPKMLYKSGLGEMTVHSQSDLETALADGWSESPV